VYLKSQGVNPAKHPVKQELERVRGYITKLKSLGPDGKPLAPTARLDVPAANRFLAHALGKSAEETRKHSRDDSEPQPAQKKEKKQKKQKTEKKSKKEKKEKKKEKKEKKKKQNNGSSEKKRRKEKS